MKKKNSCSLCNKVKSICAMDYVKNSKFLILVPVIIIALAVAITSIFGINFTADLKDNYQFTVNFGVELVEEKKAEYKEAIDTALSENELQAIKYTEVGETVYTGYIVSIDPSVTGLTDEQITEIQESLESLLHTSISKTVEVSEISLVKSNINNYVVMALIALLVAVVAIFVYTWIRHNIATATALSLVSLMAPALEFVVYGLFRLPFNMVSVAMMFVSLLVAIVLFMHIADNIKNYGLEEKNYSNNECIEKANLNIVEKLIQPMLWLGLVFVLIIFIMLFINISFALAFIGLCVAIVCAVYTAMFIGTSLWALIYKRAKDQRLRNRIAKQKEAVEKKAKKQNKKEDDDKVVV